jgi:hypothetical protein
MKRFAGTCLIASLLPALAAAGPLPPADRAFLEEKCTVCHSNERILAQRKDRAWWTELVARMKDHAEGWITDDDAARILEYLVQTQGK